MDRPAIKPTTWMQTAGKRKFDFAYPTADQVSLGDICHGLSGVERFGGHLAFPYTVAHHSLLVGFLCEDMGAKIYGLIHDFHEAYTGDIISPILRANPDLAGIWKQICFTVDGAIYKALRIEEPTVSQRQFVKDMDIQAARHEANCLFGGGVLNNWIDIKDGNKLQPYIERKVNELRELSPTEANAQLYTEVQSCLL